MTSLLTLGALTAVAVPFTPGYVKLAALLALVVGLTRILVGVLRGRTLSYLIRNRSWRGSPPPRAS